MNQSNMSSLYNTIPTFNPGHKIELEEEYKICLKSGKETVFFQFNFRPWNFSVK